MEKLGLLMKNRMGCLIILAAIGFFAILALSFGLYVRSTYNTLVERSQATDAQWANVETQLQRRFDLIPNLVESTKGIFEQEREVFGQLADARGRYAGAVTIDSKAQAASQLESALARLLVVVENYPEIRSQANVTLLMDEIAGTENRIAVERTRFNTSVQNYNNTVQRFPSNVVAGMFGYDRRTYFQGGQDTSEPPEVQF